MKQIMALLRRRSRWCILVLGLILGFLSVGTLRYFFASSNLTHYHANFAVFINGQREQFSGVQYYQEIAACEAGNDPHDLAHMHDNNSHVIHIHAKNVTWAQFFANLGWSLGNNMISDGTTVYQDGANGNISFVLNGRPTRSIADQVIGDRDRLLISFGSSTDAQLQQQFGQVQSDAVYYDTHADPAACSGTETMSVWTRLRQAFLW